MFECVFVFVFVLVFVFVFVFVRGFVCFDWWPTRSWESCFFVVSLPRFFFVSDNAAVTTVFLSFLCVHQGECRPPEKDQHR